MRNVRWSKTAWSLMRTPAMSILPLPQSMVSSVPTTFSWIPAAAVTILKMLPGSYASTTARLRQRCGEEAEAAVGIEGGPPRHGEHLTRPRIESHDHSRHRLGLGDSRGELTLDDELESRVDGEHHRVPLGRGLLDVLHRTPSRIGLDDHLLRPTTDRLVEAVLDSAHAGVVHTDPAEDLRRELPLRVVASRLAKQTDAVELEGAHASAAVAGSTLRRTHSKALVFSSLATRSRRAPASRDKERPSAPRSSGDPGRPAARRRCSPPRPKVRGASRRGREWLLGAGRA